MLSRDVISGGTERVKGAWTGSTDFQKQIGGSTDREKEIDR